MGSAGAMIEAMLPYFVTAGQKVGLLKIRLFRPFPLAAFLTKLPATTKQLIVLDRTKESGSIGEPLYLDIVSALHQLGKNIPVIG